MNDHELIINRLKLLMADRNFTVNKLAARSGVKYTTIRALMSRPTGVPKVNTLRALCQALGISVQDFLNFPPYNELPGERSLAEGDFQSEWDRFGHNLTEMEKLRIYQIYKIFQR
ncbi:helix-turn-helix transcriptional regulator [Lactobacillus sp. DCY120]|uniref:Helix-turn-helix transcriptional regulator n=1 Tax=Bombilactobacillus apium TaxID=2675299 RepID=A0A850R5F0_9LACO|nr:helix-turn-helix transcriptional regulator [Bombilactobacillus apium]NVY96077.1 helix-turn-helix transcriptional regulator [Bombilactobacillus apium]